MTSVLTTATRAIVLCMTTGVLGCVATSSTSPPAANASSLRARAQWNDASLQEVQAYARAQKTTGLLIIQDQQVIFEQNWPLPDDAESGRFRTAFVHGQAPDAADL